MKAKMGDASCLVRSLFDFASVCLHKVNFAKRLDANVHGLGTSDPDGRSRISAAQDAEGADRRTDCLADGAAGFQGGNDWMRSSNSIAFRLLGNYVNERVT